MIRLAIIAWLALCGVANAQLSGGLQFPGPGTAHSAGGGGPTFTYVGAQGGEFSNTTATFSGSLNFGSAAADRFVIIAVGRQNGASLGTTGVTVNGVSLAQDVSQTPSRGVYIWSGLVTSGSGVLTTVVTSSANDSFADCVIWAWTGTGMSTTTGASATANNATGSTGLTISVQAGDLLIGAVPFATVTDSGSTQAPTALPTATGTSSGQVYPALYWNTVTATNASFNVVVSGGAQAMILATYR